MPDEAASYFRVSRQLRFGSSIHFTCAAATSLPSLAKRHAGAVHFIIRQPDRTLALLPVWMTDASRGAQALVAHPRLPVERLADLRALVDALMASCGGEPPRCEGADDVESTTQSEGPVRRGAAGGGASARPAEQAGA